MTDLKRTAGKSLSTTAIIADGNWHRVGFSWDGSNCVLSVDDVEAARDTAGSLPACQGGLYLGGGGTTATGKFWTGLIDDVRIYNRTVRP